MDAVTFPIPPFRRRAPAAALVAAALAVQALAIDRLGWFDARLGGRGDYHALVIALVVLALALLVRTLSFGVTLALGRPLAHRGLRRATLQVAWRTPRRAHGHAAAASVLVILVVIAARLAGAAVVAPAEIARSSGALALIAGCLIVHAAVALVARCPGLAATQGWGLTGGEATGGEPTGRRPSPPAVHRPLPAPEPTMLR